MATKKRGRPRGGSPPHQPTFVEAHRLHVEASLRVDALLGECRRLRDAGRVREAQKVFAAAEELEEKLESLEAQFRPRGPGD